MLPFILIAQAQADLTGDGIPETVSLVGTPIPDSGAWQNLQLRIRDGATCRETRLPLPEDTGYAPRLWLGSLTEPDSLDLLVSVDSGGSGAIGYYTAYAYRQGAYRTIFETEAYNRRYAYRITYQNGYTVLAESLVNAAVYHIDLQGRSSDVLGEIYHDDGLLKVPLSGDVNPLSLLYPADLNGDGVYELVAYQRITGLYNADGLGDFINTLSWNGEEFALTEQTVGIFSV